jgi:poly-D-alanine transfer protein DltD
MTPQEKARQTRERKKREEEERRIQEEKERERELLNLVAKKQAFYILESELKGLYDEMDKLAKKAPNEPVTNLQLKIVNNFVKKAKHLMSGDTIIDEVEIFVAAGDNPEYRDIVTVLRQIRQGLERFETNNRYLFGRDFDSDLSEWEFDEEASDFFAGMNKLQDGTTE